MPTKNYLCVQRSSPGPSGGEKPSPEQMQKMFAAFNAWRDKYQDNIVDMGGKLGDGRYVTSEGVSDGPYAEAKELIGGYMLLAADSIEQAVEIASGVPGLVGPNGGVEVREIHRP